MNSNTKIGVKKASSQTRFKLLTSTAMVAMALSSMSAMAGPGRVCVDGVHSIGACDTQGEIGTYYANSPRLRKFVDTVAGLTKAGQNTFADTSKITAGEYISIAEPDTKSFPGSEYFVIGVVEHEQWMHSDLQKATTQRSYVQLYPSQADGGAYDSATGLPITKASVYGVPVPSPVALRYPDSKDASGNPVTGKAITWPDGSQVYGFDKAHYLGPIIITMKGTPVRVKFVNFLPNGSATVETITDGNGATKKNVLARNGDMFLPTDESLAGAGLSSDLAHRYPQNRVAFHLHGGDSPWISDGTPHQWIAASGENSPNQHGDRFMNTPDMPFPGDGAQTTFWPNDQSSRLMWYHDHTFGLTRQNAYSGAAAGYVIIDPAELALLTGGTLSNGQSVAKAIPGGLLDQIVLVVQDKTFVPDDIAAQDSKWDEKAWGTKGDLWYPHVYEPFQLWQANAGPDCAQDACSVANPAGRWDYAVDDITTGYKVPNAALRDDPDYGRVAFPDGTYTGGPSATPESYMDTPVVNGIAYPKLNVEPKAYRVRFLNGANDRYWNLSLWVAANKNSIEIADPTHTGTACPAGATPTDCTEVKMVPADGNAVYTLSGSTTYAPDDGRPGGVPDPATAGPNIIRFANEGGLLAAPVVHKPSPMNGYNDPAAGFTLARDAGTNFYLGGAERADTVIDFSQFAGKTLILYNDSSAPVPGGDSRYDYYTGDADQTTAGGAPTTLPGFGPNTRTVMQIVVGTALSTPKDYKTLSNGAYDVGVLATELPKAYAASADPHIVPATALPSNVNSSTATMTLNGVRNVALKVKTIQGFTDPNFGRLIAQIGTELQNEPVIGQGNGYAPNTSNTATPLGYIDTPTDIISDGETQYWWIKNNDVDNHPMHFHLFNVQVIARVDHFNNALIYPPQPDETGWKETIKNWPLEDVIVAVKPKTPALPFGLPRSVRNLDPTLPTNATNSTFDRPGADLTSAFFQNDVVTGLPITGGVKNSAYDFDWEYVWHCHILGHEENDLMRPLVFHPLPPTKSRVGPTAVAVDATGKVTWTDPTPALDSSGAANAASKGNTDNEIGFRVERAVVTPTSVGGKVKPAAFVALSVPTNTVVDGRVNTLANATSFQDAPAPFTDYQYRVVAVNEAGNVVSTAVSLPPAAPLGLTAKATSSATLAAGAKTATTTWHVNLNWTDASTIETGYVVQRATGTTNAATGAVTWGLPISKPTATSVLAANLGAFADGPTGVAANTMYSYQVHAVKGAIAGPVSSAIVATATTLPMPMGMQSGGNSTAAKTPNTATASLQWQPVTSTIATGYEIQHCVGTVAACAAGVWAPVPGQIKSGTTATSKVVVTGLAGKTTYQFRVRTINALIPSLYSGWTPAFQAKTL